ncbi:MAG TPA: bifunctional riboflavin kinase/FAD synthetase [Ferruginibacter sp.]|nr:bifunctional riboflavin kinase/FAD synthetase [Ferruginibacter sp.]HRE63895.1 bifunctional riboflavin kinase/FAD synthetase [Ferruginibacter sp.]
MQVHTNINQLPPFKNAVLTIGSFDGVHSGHRAIIDQLVKEATAIGGTPVVITFYPHPKMVIGNQAEPVMVLNTREEKYRLLNKAGIEHIVEVPFTRDFAQQTAEEYIRNFLVEKFHPHTIIIGYDHKFGNNREGDYRLLETYASTYRYKVHEIPEHVLQNITISSTKIRKALLSGDIDTAKQYLGYGYFFSGLVVKGNQLGRTIGFPTANIVFTEPEKLVPANGVYAVTVKRNGHSGTLKGMMNIGTRPTVGEGLQRTIEVNILDFNEDIYGEMLTVHFVKWLRSELKFNGLEELKAAIQKDKETCEELIQMGEM